MDHSLDPNSPLLGQLLWSADPATQNTIILVLAAAALALFFVYAPLIVRLVRLHRLDGAVGEACGPEWRPTEARRDEVARAFAGSPVESQWDEFVGRWRSAEALGEGERAPVRLLDIFDERPVVPTGAIKSLLPALPGLFLAVGVLGSFVGLAAAVSSGGGEDAASAVGVRIGLALRSGLWGLILAITAAVGGRLLEGLFDRLAESLDRTVERAFEAMSSGELSSLSSRVQNNAMNQLGAELKRFASDLTERVDRGLQRIEESTSSAASLVTEQQRGALQNVVRELSLQVQTGVEQHLTALHQVLERAVDHQGAVTGGLAEAFDQMAENATVHARVTQTLEQSAQAVQEAATSMSGTAHDLSPVLEQLRETSSALSETATTMNTTQEVVAHGAEGIRSSIDHATAALSEQRQFIETGLEEVRGTIQLMSAGLGENLSQALRNVDEALEHTVGRLRDTIEDSNSTIDRLASPVRAAEGTTREMQTALERVRDEVLALGEWTSQAVRPLKTNLAQLEDRVGDITRALAAFGDQAAHVDKTMDALRGEIHEEGRRSRASSAELARHLKMAVDAAAALRAGPADHTAQPASTPKRAQPLGPREPAAPTTTSPSAAPGEALSATGKPAIALDDDRPTERPPAPAPASAATRANAPAQQAARLPEAGPESRFLGPDPYARITNPSDALDRQRRILESGRAMHDLEVDDRSGVDDEDDDLSLSGLLKQPTRDKGAASDSTTRPQRSVSNGDSNEDASRPRAWQRLEKD